MTNHLKHSKLVQWPNWDKIKFSPKQAEIYNCKSKRICVKAGRAFGKDHILIIKALVECFKLYYKRITNPEWQREGEVVSMMIVAPTHTNSVDLWGRLISQLPEIGGIAPNSKPNIHVKTEDKVIEIFGGDILIYFNSTARSDNLRGRGVDILLVTECAYHKESTIIKVLIPFCIRPNYEGIVYFNSTPKGKSHWFDTYIEEFKHGKGYLVDMGFELFEGTFYDNPTTTEDVVMSFKAALAKNVYDARREYLGWINVPVLSDFFLNAGEELAFTGDRIKQVLLNNPVSNEGPYVAHIDVAGNGKDNCCVCVLDRNGVIVRLEKHAKTTEEDIINIVLRINKMYRPHKFSYDANKMYLNKENGRLVAVPLVPHQMNNTLKNKMVGHFIHHLICGTVKIPNPDMYYRYIEPPSKYMKENLHLLLTEMYTYKKYTCLKQKVNKSVITDDTEISYHKPVEGSDDMLDALIGAAYNMVVPYHIKELQAINSEADTVVEEKKNVLEPQQGIDIYALHNVKRKNNLNLSNIF